MNSLDHGRWLMSVNELATVLTTRFEERFGYPPSENRAVPATEEPPGLEALPDPLAEFYRHVSEVWLMDLHVGYTVWPAQHTLNGLDGTHPVRIDGPESVDVVTFGSDGGGTLLALGLPDGAPVYTLPASAVDRSGVYDNFDSRARVVAATLPEFLTKLKHMLEDATQDRLDPSHYFS